MAEVDLELVDFMEGKRILTGLELRTLASESGCLMGESGLEKLIGQQTELPQAWREFKLCIPGDDVRLVFWREDQQLWDIQHWSLGHTFGSECRMVRVRPTNPVGDATTRQVL